MTSHKRLTWLPGGDKIIDYTLKSDCWIGEAEDVVPADVTPRNRFHYLAPRPPRPVQSPSRKPCLRYGFPRIQIPVKLKPCAADKPRKTVLTAILRRKGRVLDAMTIEEFKNDYNGSDRTASIFSCSNSLTKYVTMIPRSLSSAPC